jgi:hypothetical protein
LEFLILVFCFIVLMVRPFEQAVARVRATAGKEVRNVGAVYELAPFFFP